MRSWKRHLALPALLAAIAVLVSNALGVDAGKRGEKLAWTDLEGNRSAIADVTLSGTLADGYHRVAFAARGGKVTSETTVYATLRRARPLQVIFGERIGRFQFQVYGGRPYEIRRYDGSVGGSVTVSPPLVATANEYTNAIETGIANIGDRYYFTVPTTRSYTGTNGIYQLNFDYPKDGDRGTSYRLAEIPLGKNADPSSSGIEILGLEAVGDKLALLTAEDGKLIVSSYDSGSGELLGRVAIDGFALAGRPEAKGKPEAYYEGYHAYADESQDFLSLRFRGSAADGASRNTVWSVSLKRGEEKLLGKTELGAIKGMIAPDTFKFDGDQIRYMDGRLYVVRAMTDDDETSNVAMPVARPMRMFLEAYEGDTLLYRGELKSGMNDDAFNIQDPTLRSAGYGYEDNRSYYDLRIDRTGA